MPGDEGALSVCYRLPLAVDGRMRPASGTLFLGLRHVCLCIQGNSFEGCEFYVLVCTSPRLIGQLPNGRRLPVWLAV